MSSDDERARRILRAACERARQRWPGIKFSCEDFEAFIRELLGEPLDPSRLEALRLEDLFLAGACLMEDPVAFKTLDAEFLIRLIDQLRHLNLTPEQFMELLQRLRVHLLMGDPPRFSTYKGEGALSSWLYVIAVRMAYKLLETGRELPEDVLEILAARPDPGPSPDQMLIQQSYRPEFIKALRDAFAVLSPEDRLLLKLSFEQSLSTTSLGKVFGKHQSTMSRALKRVYGLLFARTKQLLQERLGLGSDSFKSLLLSLRSQMDLRLSQVLGHAKSGPPCPRRPPRFTLKLRRKHAPWYLPKPRR